MKKSTIVIGLDAAEPRLVEEWMAEGHLPNLSKKGFLLGIGKEPDIPRGTNLTNGEAVDLAPTILNLMEAKIPDYL